MGLPVGLFLGRLLYSVLRKSNMFLRKCRDKADRYCKLDIKEGVYEGTGMRYRRKRGGKGKQEQRKEKKKK